MAVDFTKLNASIAKYVGDVNTLRASQPDEATIQASVDAAQGTVDAADAALAQPLPPTT